MYIADFAKRVFKKQNTGIIIYLILNTLIVMGLFQDVLTGLILYLLSLIIALSPVGEWILRVQQGCKPLTKKEHIDRLMPLFNEVYIKARKLDPTIAENIQLFISNDPSPNAFATGRRTICLTSGLLQYSDDQIRATLAHEFGHLSHKDTDLILIVAVGNMIVSIMFVLYRLIISAVGIMVSIANRSFGSLIVSIFIDVMLVAMMWLWTKFGTMLVMHTSRKNEFEADYFAYQLGYGDSLVQVLNSFNEMEMVFTKGLWANLASSHPEPLERIEKLQQTEVA
jgi:heat shock protein HtpX